MPKNGALEQVPRPAVRSNLLHGQSRVSHMSWRALSAYLINYRLSAILDHLIVFPLMIVRNWMMIGAGAAAFWKNLI